MATYRFGHDPAFGVVRDVAVEPSGDILVLSQAPSPTAVPRFRVTRCDYRGTAKRDLELGE